MPNYPMLALTEVWEKVISGICMCVFVCLSVSSRCKKTWAIDT